MKLSFKIICICISLLVWSDCTMLKMGSLFLSGRMHRQNFKKEIDFEYRGRLIFIYVKLNQSPKTYQFVFDTGAAFNVISKEIAAELGIKTRASDDISDVTKKRDKVEFGKIPLITIGGIPFEDTATAILNVDKTPRLRCYGIKGVIGMNLIRLIPVWQINYRDRKIVFTDNRELLKHTGSSIKIPFTKNIQRIPEIRISIDELVKIKCEVDLGSAHGFLSSLDNWKEIKKNNPRIVTVTGYGEGFQGALGKSRGSYYISKLDKVTIGGHAFGSQLMEFTQDTYKHVGNRFFEDYVFTLDWGKKEILLAPVSVNDDKSKLITYGFVYSFNEEQNALVVSFIYRNSPAEKAGLKIDDRIVSINEKSTDKVTHQDYCRLYFRPELLYKGDQLNMVILRGNKKKEISISRATLIE